MSTDNPSRLAKAAKRSRAEQKKIKNFLFKALQDEAGIAFFYDLLASTHLWHSAYTGEAHSTNFQLGEQNIGLKLLTDITAVSEAGYLEILKYGQRRDRDNNPNQPESGNDGAGSDDDSDSGADDDSGTS